MTRQFLQTDFTIPKDPDLQRIMLKEYLETIASAVNSIPITEASTPPAPSPPAPSPPAYLETTIDCGQLPNRGEKLVDHHIPWTNSTRVLKIEGVANNPGVAAMPITPFADCNVLAYGVTVVVFSHQILILTAVDYRRFTESFVTIRYTN